MDWKTKRINEILGIPKLDVKYLPPHVIIQLKEKCAEIKEIGAVILFGSLVRGEGSPKSDIDIMVVPLKQEQLESLKEKIMKLLREIEVENRLEASFSLIIYTSNEDPYFLWETISDGVVIYIKPELVLQSIKSVKPYTLISYSYSGLNNNIKKKVQRFIFESKNGLQIDRNNKMEYIAPGVLLFPLEKSKSIIKFFDDIHMKYSLIKIWK
jgi:predicted nucleotidyltransferase